MAFGGAGGDDELQGFVEYTFFRPDGSQLGTQGEGVVFPCQSADKSQHIVPGCRIVSRHILSSRHGEYYTDVVIGRDPQGFRNVSLLWSA